MDISEEPVIFPVDIQKMMTEDAGLLAISGAECPRAFTAKDSVTHNSLLLLKTKWTWLDDEKNIFTTNYILYLSSMATLCSICILGVAETWL